MLIVRGRRIVLPTASGPQSIHIDADALPRFGDVDDAASVGARRSSIVDAGDLVVSPGVVDTHVHINEPGRTEWEGFETATRAAAAGGVTTIIDMPLNSIPATTTSRRLTRSGARRAASVMSTSGFWGARCRAISPAVHPATATCSSRSSTPACAGSSAFWCRQALTSSSPSTSAHLRRAMPVLARQKCAAAGPCGAAGSHHAASGTACELPRLRGDASGGRRSRRDSPDGAPGRTKQARTSTSFTCRRPAVSRRLPKAASPACESRGRPVRTT